MVKVLIGIAVGAAVGALAGLLVKLRARSHHERTEWAFIGSPGRGAILGAVVGFVFAFYFGGPYSWRTEAESNVIALTGDTFDAALTGPKPLIAVFYRDSCPSCNGFAPTVEQLADEYEGRLTVAKIDAASETDLVDRFDVDVVPTTIFFANGRTDDPAQTDRVSLSALRERADALLKTQAPSPEPSQPIPDETATDDTP